MCKVIAVSSYKGGVAKTTSAVSIGIEMAHLGKKVLLINGFNKIRSKVC